MTGCSLINNVVNSATGGNVPEGLGTGQSVPADFPSEVPLIDGDVVFGLSLPGDNGEKAWNVTINVSGARAFETIKTQLTDAGFEYQELSDGRVGIDRRVHQGPPAACSSWSRPATARSGPRTTRSPTPRPASDRPTPGGRPRGARAGARSCSRAARCPVPVAAAMLHRRPGGVGPRARRRAGDGGGDPNAQVPATFPADIPLIDGDVLESADLGTGWVVLFGVDDAIASFDSGADALARPDSRRPSARPTRPRASATTRTTSTRCRSRRTPTTPATARRCRTPSSSAAEREPGQPTGPRSCRSCWPRCSPS